LHQEYKYLFLLSFETIWWNYLWLCSQNSPSFCCAVRELMKLCVQLVTSLYTLYTAVASELNFLPYEFGHEKLPFDETPSGMFVLH
jgi:hypothetical protein